MSRVERLLKAIIQNGSYDEERLSRVEDILYAFLKDHEYTKDPESRMEALLIFLKEKKLYDDVTLSRVEDILKAKIDGVEYTKDPESRVEELLIMWDVIREYDRYISGTLPLHLTDSIGADLVDWSITGDTVQDGTPSPENVVEVKGVGDRTGNLFDIETWGTPTSSKGSIEKLPDGLKLTATADDLYTYTYGSNNPSCSYPVIAGKTYTISWNVDDPTVPGLVYVFTGVNVAGTVLNNAASSSKSVTFKIPEGHKALAFRIGVSRAGDSIAYTNIMLNEGSTPLPYEPYGVKIPVVSRGKNLFDDEALSFGIISSDTGIFTTGTSAICSDFIHLKANRYYTLEIFKRCSNNKNRFYSYPDKQYIGYTFENSSFTLQATDRALLFTKDVYIRFEFDNNRETGFGQNTREFAFLHEGVNVYGAYEPYRQPITTTQYLPTPLMANERLTPTAREVKWKELVLTGSESWTRQNISTTDANYARFGTSIILDSISVKGTADYAYCSNFVTVVQNGTSAATAINCFEIRNKDGIATILIITNKTTANETFKSWLKSEYDAGHPVTVWYQLANPTTEPVTTTPIGTLDGECWIDVDTEVRPPYAEVTYKTNTPQFFILDKSLLDSKEGPLK